MFRVVQPSAQSMLGHFYLIFERILFRVSFKLWCWRRLLGKHKSVWVPWSYHKAEKVCLHGGGLLSWWPWGDELSSTPCRFLFPLSETSAGEALPNLPSAKQLVLHFSEAHLPVPGGPGESLFR